MNARSNTPIDQNFINDLMVQIPEGRVDLRDDRINKKWEVRINTFFLSSLPLTQDIYFAITGENPSTFSGPGLPLETVSWIEAITFCNMLSRHLGLVPYYTIDKEAESIEANPFASGIRLPTEAEWQYACQAGSKEVRYGDLETISWYKGNSHGSTQIAGKKEPNDWGLYDMLGNVWEWCSDVYDETTYGSYRIFRGGGWCDEKRSVMATTRRRSHPFSFKIDDLGFRIARNLDAVQYKRQCFKQEK